MPRSVGSRPLAAALVAAALLAGCGSSSPSAPPDYSGSGYPGTDLASTRQAKGTIESGNVDQLEVAWKVPLQEGNVYGSYASTPIVSDGIVYSQELSSDVKAIDLKTGKVLWTKAFGGFSDFGYGPNGLAVTDGRVYGATAHEAFALDQKTGKELWSTRLSRRSSEGIDMAPGVDHGRVYMSTVPLVLGVDYPPGDVGTLYALDAKTGKKLWHFDTVPRGLWGHPEINSGGGLWYPPSFDGHGDLYAGTGNAGPFPGTTQYPWGSSRPGRNLYIDSMIKLDGKSGKLRWYYQQTPHDVADWDFQDSPILLREKGREVAIGAGKSGVVVALDAKTGEPLWKTPVGPHNGHDDDGLLAMRKEYSKLSEQNVTVNPGLFSGVMGQMASDGSLVFVPVVDEAMGLSASAAAPSGEGKGEVVALDPASGKVKWTVKLPSMAYGSLTVVNDVVFATTAEGKLYAFDAESGDEAWSTKLPSGSYAGVTVSGDMLVTGAGLSRGGASQGAQLVAYRLGG
jgi:alcohol dehydrogenase (cytochrome c)